jgi:cytoskeletal protein RodZ
MATVGEQLRAAREARKLRVQDVAKATNMRTDHVQALEEGNYAPFPAPVYIRGSVRTYAKLLNLDVMSLMADLTAEMNLETRAEDPSAGPGHRRGVIDFIALQLARFGWKRTAVALAILAIIFLSLLVRVLRSDEPESDPLADLPPPTYQPARSSDGGYLPLPGTNQ